MMLHLSGVRGGDGNTSHQVVGLLVFVDVGGGRAVCRGHRVLDVKDEQALGVGGVSNVIQERLPYEGRGVPDWRYLQFQVDHALGRPWHHGPMRHRRRVGTLHRCRRPVAAGAAPRVIGISGLLRGRILRGGGHGTCARGHLWSK